jgi:hypothetical protein
MLRVRIGNNSDKRAKHHDGVRSTDHQETDQRTTNQRENFKNLLYVIKKVLKINIAQNRLFQNKIGKPFHLRFKSYLLI